MMRHKISLLCPPEAGLPSSDLKNSKVSRASSKAAPFGVAVLTTSAQSARGHPVLVDGDREGKVGAPHRVDLDLICKRQRRVCLLGTFSADGFIVKCYQCQERC